MTSGEEVFERILEYVGRSRLKVLAVHVSRTDYDVLIDYLGVQPPSSSVILGFYYGYTFVKVKCII